MGVPLIIDKNGRKYLISGRKKYRILYDIGGRGYLLSKGRLLPIITEDDFRLHKVSTRLHEIKEERIKQMIEYWEKMLNAEEGKLEQISKKSFEKFSEEFSNFFPGSTAEGHLLFNLQYIRDYKDFELLVKLIKIVMRRRSELIRQWKTKRKEILETMWKEIRICYYKRLKPNKELDKAKRYQTIAEKFNKKYGPLLAGKRLPVPKEDAFWKKFYSINDRYSKKIK